MQSVYNYWLFVAEWKKQKHVHEYEKNRLFKVIFFYETRIISNARQTSLYSA